MDPTGESVVVSARLLSRLEPASRGEFEIAVKNLGEPDAELSRTRVAYEPGKDITVKELKGKAEPNQRVMVWVTAI